MFVSDAMETSVWNDCLGLGSSTNCITDCNVMQSCMALMIFNNDFRLFCL